MIDAVTDPHAESSASNADVARTARPILRASNFCRACGADEEGDPVTCSACGGDVRDIPVAVEGSLGTVYSLRRGLRKRSAVRIGGDDQETRLLFTDGETLVVPVGDLPAPVEPDIGRDSLAPARSPRGVLI